MFSTMLGRESSSASRKKSASASSRNGVEECIPGKCYIRAGENEAIPKDGFMLALLPDFIAYVVVFGVTPGFRPGAGRGM